MIKPEVLDAMVAAGCTAQQIAAAVKADMMGDDERRAAKRANNADRQRRHRERNAPSRVTGVTNGDNPPPSPSPLSSPPTPPPIIPQSPSTTPETKRATRLASDWQLPAAWGRWAIEQGHSEASIRLEADKFRDFWIGKSGKDATKLDWEATWRNWMRNAGRPRGNSQAPPSGTGNAMVDRLDELMNGMGQRNADERRTIEGSNEHGAYDRAPQAVLGPAASQGRR